MHGRYCCMGMYLKGAMFGQQVSVIIKLFILVSDNLVRNGLSSFVFVLLGVMGEW